MSRLGAGLRRIFDFLIRGPLGAAPLGIALLIVVLVGIWALRSPAINRQLEALGGAEPAAPAEVVDGPDSERGSEALSGTWRVFQGGPEGRPLFDLTFGPGRAAVLLAQSDIPGAVQSWSHEEKGSSVEIAMTLRYVAKDGGVYTPRCWLHLTREDDAMRGSLDWEDYIYEGREKGMTVRGVSTVPGGIYARPK